MILVWRSNNQVIQMIAEDETGPQSRKTPQVTKEVVIDTVRCDSGARSFAARERRRIAHG